MSRKRIAIRISISSAVVALAIEIARILLRQFWKG